MLHCPPPPPSESLPSLRKTLNHCRAADHAYIAAAAAPAASSNHGGGLGGGCWKVCVNVDNDTRCEELTFRIEAGVNVAGMKKILMREKGYPVELQRWIFGGYVLDDKLVVGSHDGGPERPWFLGDSGRKLCNVLIMPTGRAEVVSADAGRESPREAAEEPPGMRYTAAVAVADADGELLPPSPHCLLCLCIAFLRIHIIIMMVDSEL